MNRREFLATTAAAVAGGAIAAAQPATTKPAPGAASDAKPARAKRTLKKAVMIGMVQEGSTFEDKLKILKDAGFQGVEGDSPDHPWTVDEMKAAQEKVGLKVHGLVDSQHWRVYLNAPDQKAQDEAVRALETCLREGQKLGCTSILLVPGVVNSKLRYDDCWKLSQQNIRRVLPLAKETGVKIAVENVWNGFIMSPMEAARYVDELNDPMVGWHFDIGNVINFGWPDQWVRILGKRLLKLHIKDFSRKKRDEEGLWKGFGVELGQGDAGWASVMAALDEVGYSTDPAGNWATAEVGGGDAKRLKQVSEQMDALFAM